MGVGVSVGSRMGVGVSVGCIIEIVGVTEVPVGISICMEANPAEFDLVNNHIARRTPSTKTGNDLFILGGIFQ